jgi:hypothetical protein
MKIEVQPARAFRGWRVVDMSTVPMRILGVFSLRADADDFATKAPGMEERIQQIWDKIQSQKEKKTSQKTEKAKRGKNLK